MRKQHVCRRWEDQGIECPMRGIQEVEDDHDLPRRPKKIGMPGGGKKLVPLTSQDLGGVPESTAIAAALPRAMMSQIIMGDSLASAKGKVPVSNTVWKQPGIAKAVPVAATPLSGPASTPFAEAERTLTSYIASVRRGGATTGSEIGNPNASTVVRQGAGQQKPQSVDSPFGAQAIPTQILSLAAMADSQRLTRLARGGQVRATAKRTTQGRMTRVTEQMRIARRARLSRGRPTRAPAIGASRSRPSVPAGGGFHSNFNAWLKRQLGQPVKQSVSISDIN